MPGSEPPGRIGGRAGVDLEQHAQDEEQSLVRLRVEIARGEEPIEPGQRAVPAERDRGVNGVDQGDRAAPANSELEARCRVSSRFTRGPFAGAGGGGGGAASDYGSVAAEECSERLAAYASTLELRVDSYVVHDDLGSEDYHGPDLLAIADADKLVTFTAEGRSLADLAPERMLGLRELAIAAEHEPYRPGADTAEARPITSYHHPRRAPAPGAPLHDQPLGQPLLPARAAECWGSADPRRVIVPTPLLAWHQPERWFLPCNGGTVMIGRAWQRSPRFVVHAFDPARPIYVQRG